MKQIRKTWPLKDQAQLLKRLGEMTAGGYTLLDALRLMELQMNKRQVADLIDAVTRLGEGAPFYQVLKSLSFHKEAVGICYFAETHGELPASMIQSGELLKRKIAQADQLKRVLRYPLFLIFTVAVMFYMLQSIIIPQFSGIYQSMNMETTRSTDILFAFFQHVDLLIILAALFAAGFGLYYWLVFKKKSPVRQMLIWVRIPLAGNLVRLFNSYFFSLQLSSLLQSGLSIYDSLNAFKHQTFLPFYRCEAEQVIERLKAGESLETALSGSPFYEADLTKVISHGQLNGRLDRELFTYSQFIMQRLELKAQKWTGILQPMIYGFVAAMILVVYLSMLLPMYQMMNQM
ncbi:competence type IV pilus assembly protein ComGB [Bacillus sp. C28GYM-DRY-1]|uniref:competence type IV pilus assembly protein ComGB n=1 Tax=Bacillus sp. C28GYM-DRY-1 TaxID=3062686 RepID=UPI002674E405|nr:competence type IV pilus assembly protein ComGB [Bacillus sp. C28GYM-DRY-1]MDO3662622.1 competence type IV pilus assembly protein ComGB [Bacillus sp. C28GYM-DRY-1]